MPELTFKDSRGNSIIHQVDPAKLLDSLYAILHKHGVAIGQCAGHGICQQCQFKISSGTLRIIQEPMVEQSNNHHLSCCTTADGKSDATVEFTSPSVDFSSRNPS